MKIDKKLKSVVENIEKYYINDELFEAQKQEMVRDIKRIIYSEIKDIEPKLQDNIHYNEAIEDFSDRLFKLLVF